MIQKIKDLMQVKELIDDIGIKVSAHSTQIGGFSQQLSELTTALVQIKDSQEEFLTNFKSNLDTISECKESLRKEIYDFRLLKAQTQKSLLEKFEEELSKELKVNSEKIRTDMNEYNKLKEQTALILLQLGSLSTDIGKLKQISANIKKEDFELSRFGNQLMQMDKEKLELMRKIDTLERLISRMRRQ